jgi:predicted nucleotidyltransferase
LLFGSRVAGKSNESSDYDFLIITRDKLDDGKKMELASELRKTLAAAETDIDADIIIKSVSEIKSAKELIGGVIREALKAGVHI